MRRGFKAEAEREASYQRQLLNLRAHEPLLARKLTKHHQVLVTTPELIPDMTVAHICQLLEVDESGWSAVTVHGKGQRVIIHNPTHSAGRQESNLVHEMSHLIRDHQPTKLITIPGSPFVLRTYDHEQEQEADWLAGCLKLPREALLWAVRRGMGDASIADHFRASFRLVQYRRHIRALC